MNIKTKNLKALILLVFIIFISGCTSIDNITGFAIKTQNNENTINNTANNNQIQIETFQKCNQLNGYICNSKDDCASTQINTIENYCCPIQCNICQEDKICNDNNNNTQDICTFENGKTSCTHEQIISENTTEKNTTIIPVYSYFDGSSGGGSTNTKEETEIIDTPKCPESCNDQNTCTNDYCSESTNYQCISDVITPCCGNNICESGESYALCPEDCENPCPFSCDDGDMYTLDYCNETTNYQCDHINIDCIDNDGICAKGCTYYQYDNDCSQIQRIDYGGDTKNIQVDEEYIYLTASHYEYTPPSENYIKIYNKTSLKLVKIINFSSYHPNRAEIGALYVDDNKIYVGSVDGELKIYNKTDFSFISQISNLSTAYYRTPVGITTDNENIYIAIASDMIGYNILVYYKLNHTLKKKIPAHANLINYIAVDKTYIYSNSDDDMIKIWDKNSGLLIDSILEDPVSITTDENNIYLYIDSSHDVYDSSLNNKKIKIYQKSNFSLKQIIPLSSEDRSGMSVDDNYLYLAYWDGGKVSILNKTNGVFIKNLYGDAERYHTLHTVKDDYLYLLYGGSLMIWKNVNLNNTYSSYFQIPDFEPMNLYFDSYYDNYKYRFQILPSKTTTEVIENNNGIYLMGVIQNVENSLYAYNYANILINGDIYEEFDYLPIDNFWNTSTNYLSKFPSWNPEPGEYTIELITDPDNKIKERNENNNILTKNLTVINNSFSPEIISVSDNIGSGTGVSSKKFYLMPTSPYILEINGSDLMEGDNLTFYVNAFDPDGDDDELLYDFSVLYENTHVNLCSWNSSNVCNLTISNEMLTKTILITIAIKDNDSYYYAFNESLGDDYTFMKYIL